MPCSDRRHPIAPAPAPAWGVSTAGRSFFWRYTAERREPTAFHPEGGRTMTFASGQELIEGTRQVIDLNGGVRVKDPAALRGESIDRLVHTAVFAEGDVREAARWLIWEAGWEVGIQSASIDALYQARARGEYEGITVPAVNVRAMA